MRSKDNISCDQRVYSQDGGDFIDPQLVLCRKPLLPYYTDIKLNLQLPA